MKYCVLIMDGAAGWPLPEKDNCTSLEAAKTPNLDRLAKEARVGLTRTVPPGMEPSSALACMSILGYDPAVYYKGRAGIEAVSMGVPVGPDDVVFRCNLVAVAKGKMWDYSAGHISTDIARELIAALNQELGSDEVQFYPGVSCRHICKITGHADTLQAICTPPHDISDKEIVPFLPKGKGSRFLRNLMKRSEEVLQKVPVNNRRKVTGQTPATTIWLFWGTGKLTPMPKFVTTHGVKAAMTSGVDLLRGLAQMASMDILEIPGVTDGPDNDYVGQATGAIKALQKHDLVIVHIEAADEAGHSGSISEKVEAIEKMDKEVVGRLMAVKDLRLLVMPDHPTPIKIKTHCDDPAPFLLWGNGFAANGARRFTEAEAKKTGLFVEAGYTIMGKLIGEKD